jgi:ketosteroid isomerase-like protein
MNRLVLASFAWLLLASFHSAPLYQTDQTAKELESIKSEIQLLDQQINVAAVNGDTKTLGTAMSDDYVGVAPNGMILRKAVMAQHYQAGTLHYASVVNSDIEIHLHDDCAVLTAIALVKGHDGDTDLSGTYRIMRVFLRRGTEWKIVAFQATPIRQSGTN